MHFQAGDRDATLVTQMIWGKTTHVGCGWTQFPITDSSNNGGWGLEKYRHLYAKAEYENFFVCNYGVGGNVPGEPIYVTDCGKNEADNSFPMSNVRYMERYENSTIEAKNEINECLVAINCLKSLENCDDKAEICLSISQTPEGPTEERDLQYIVNTVHNLYFENVWNDRETIQIIECNIELLLCSLPNISPASKVDQVCVEGLEECILREDALPATKTVSISKSTIIQPIDETTSFPETSTSSPMIGSTGMDVFPESTTTDDEKFDISVYNSTSKTSFRLAVCLAGIQCTEDTPKCELIFQKCNEGINVTNLPFKVKQKLSECSVSDLLCNLDEEKGDDCEKAYLDCIFIVVPEKYSSELFTMTKVESETPSNNPLQEIFDLLQDKGLGTGLADDSDQIVNLTTAVLGAIGETFNGIEIEPLDGDDLSAVLNHSDPLTIPIFNEITLLLNDTDDKMTLFLGDETFQLDLTNSTAIFSPNDLAVGSGDSNLTTLRENIIKSLEDKAIICQKEGKCGSDGSNKIHVDSNQETPNSLQYELAICLNGAECEDEMCEKAQKHCIGEDGFSKTSKEVRKQLSACYVASYVCLLRNLDGQNICRAEFNGCVLSANGEEAVDVVSSIIEQVADELVKVYPEREDVTLEVKIASLNDLPTHFQIETQDDEEGKKVSVKIAPEKIKSTTKFEGKKDTYLTIDKNSKTKIKAALRGLLESIFPRDPFITPKPAVNSNTEKDISTLLSNQDEEATNGKEIQQNTVDSGVHNLVEMDPLSQNISSKNKNYNAIDATAKGDETTTLKSNETPNEKIKNVDPSHEVKELEKSTQKTSFITISKPVKTDLANKNKQEAVDFIKKEIAEGVQEVIDISQTSSQEAIDVKVEVTKSPAIKESTIEVSKDSEKGVVTAKVALAGPKETTNTVKIKVDQTANIYESVKDAIDDIKDVVEEGFPETKASTSSVDIPVPVAQDDEAEAISNKIKAAVQDGVGLVAGNNHDKGPPPTEVKISVKKTPAAKIPSVTVQMPEDSKFEADITVPSKNEIDILTAKIPIDNLQQEDNENSKVSLDQESLADTIDNLVDPLDVKEAVSPGQATLPITLSKPLEKDFANKYRQEAVDAIKEAVAEGIQKVINISPTSSQEAISVKVEVMKSPAIKEPTVEVTKDSEKGDVTTKVALAGPKETTNIVKIKVDQASDIYESVKDAINEIKEILEDGFPTSKASPSSVDIPVPVAQDDDAEAISNKIKDAVQAGVGLLAGNNRDKGLPPPTEVKISVNKTPAAKIPAVTVQVQEDSTLEADIIAPSKNEIEISTAKIPVDNMQQEGIEKSKVSLNQESLAEAIDNLVNTVDVNEAAEPVQAMPPITLLKPLETGFANKNRQEAVDAIKEAVAEGIQEVINISPTSSQEAINVKIEVMKSPAIKNTTVEVTKDSEIGDVTTKVALAGPKETTTTVKIKVDQVSDIYESVKDAIDEIKDVMEEGFPTSKASPSSVDIPVPVGQDDDAEAISNKIKAAVQAGVGLLAGNNRDKGLLPPKEVKISVKKTPAAKIPSVTVQLQEDSTLEADIIVPSKNEIEISTTKIPVDNMQQEGNEKSKVSLNQESLADTIDNFVDPLDVREAAAPGQAMPPITLLKPLETGFANMNKQEAVDVIKEAAAKGVQEVIDISPTSSQEGINVKVEVTKSPAIKEPTIEVSKNSEKDVVTTKVALAGPKETTNTVTIKVNQPSDVYESVKDAIDEIKEVVEEGFPETKASSSSIDIPIPVARDDEAETISNKIKAAVQAGVGLVAVNNLDKSLPPPTEVKISVKKTPAAKIPSVTVQVQKDLSLEADITVPSKNEIEISTAKILVGNMKQEGNEKSQVSLDQESLADTIENFVDPLDVKEAAAPGQAMPPITLLKPLETGFANKNKQEAVGVIKEAAAKGVQEVIDISPTSSQEPINVKVEVTKSPAIKEPTIEVSKDSEKNVVITKVALAGPKETTNTVTIKADQASDIYESVKDAIDEMKEILEEGFPTSKASPSSVDIPVPVAQDDEAEAISNKIKDAVQAGVGLVAGNNQDKGLPPPTEVIISVKKNTSCQNTLCDCPASGRLNLGSRHHSAIQE